MRSPDQTPRVPPLAIAPAEREIDIDSVFYNLGGVVHESTDLLLRINRRVRLMWVCLERFGPKLHNKT